MASSREDGPAATATAQQLGSMSLGESTEKKDSETGTNTKNGTPTKKEMCSACGKKSSTLMKCRACKCVWYCDKDCQNKHWKEHKTECKPIKKELDKRGGKLDLGTEEDIGPLGKLPPKEECPICMRALPLHAMLQTYANCCGKFLCSGCNFQHQVKHQRQATKKGQTPLPLTCAFCRTTLPDSDEEILARVHKRIELKDPKALRNMAMYYGQGDLGVSVDQAKCIDLLRQSVGLGCPGAHYQLASFHHTGEMGLEQNEEEASKYLEKATEGGHVPALYNLGCIENNSGNSTAAMRHWRLSASGGHKRSMDALISCFDHGLLRHGNLAKSLQAFHRARAEMKSEDRDVHIAYLKRTGKYREEYDL